MAYLSQPTSKLDYGVVKVGNNIIVSDAGVISSPTIIEGVGIHVNYANDLITIATSGINTIDVYNTSSNYTLTANDEYLGVSSANAVTITLPSSVSEGRVYIIKDEYGQGSGKITIQPPSGTLIDKKPNYVISVPNQSVQVVYRGAGWWII